MAKDTKATPLTEEQLNQKEADLQIQSEKLEKERADFESEKSQLETEKEDFEFQKEGLRKESEKFDTYVNEKLAEFENKDEIEDFEYEGDIYFFSFDAPQIINYGGQKFTRSEIVKNEHVLLQLIGGNSSLIIKK